MTIDPQTQLFGVVGYPLGHTSSPTMHNAAFAAIGINAVYLAFETKDIKGCMVGMRALGIRGLSVTIPYKAEVIPFLDDVQGVARRIGAVNTIVNENGRLIGYNTDGLGALKALEKVVQSDTGTCLLLGAGGAARAIGFVLKERGMDVTIVNRSPERGKELADFLGCRFTSLENIGNKEAELLIQATPVGMYPQHNQCPVPESILKKEMVVMDIVYNPPQTRLLKLARARGCLTVGGLAMFIHQGAEQFRLWTGQNPPIEVMAGAVTGALVHTPNERD
jgi:shikimate dehydrogenase